MTGACGSYNLGGSATLLDEVEVEVLQEGLVGATMIGIDNDSSIRSQVKPRLQVSTCFFLFCSLSTEE